MKVNHICSNYDKFYVNFMNEQINNNILPTVFYFRAIQRGKLEIKEEYVDLRLNFNEWNRYFFYLKHNKVLQDYYRLYTKDQFEVIHAHTLFSNGYIAYKVNKKWNIPYIVAVRDVDLNIFFKYRFNLRKLGVKILENAEKIVFISKSYEKQLFEKYIPYSLRETLQKKSIVIPNGVDEFFLNNIYDLKKEEAVTGTIEIITVGHIYKRKNQLAVCKAIKLLIEEGYKIKYTVIGKILDDNYYKEVMSYKFVTHIPFMNQKELLSYYRKSHIFAMPSITETFGLTYVEAMSQGLPVLYSKKQGFDGYFKDGYVGKKVSSDNIEEISSAIVYIINNYTNISKKCIENVSRFDWISITKQYVEMYNEVKTSQYKGEKI